MKWTHPRNDKEQRSTRKTPIWFQSRCVSILRLNHSTIDIDWHDLNSNLLWFPQYFTFYHVAIIQSSFRSNVVPTKATGKCVKNYLPNSNYLRLCYAYAVFDIRPSHDIRNEVDNWTGSRNTGSGTRDVLLFEKPNEWLQINSTIARNPDENSISNCNRCSVVHDDEIYALLLRNNLKKISVIEICLRLSKVKHL